MPEGPRKEPGRREISDVGLIEFCEFLLSNAGGYSYSVVNPGLTWTDGPVDPQDTFRHFSF